MTNLLLDFRYSLKSLARQPSFTLLVLLILAVGLGAGTAIFSVANAVLLRPLPFKDADRLVFLWNRLATGVDKSAVAPPDLADFEQKADLFEGVAGILTSMRPLTEEGGEPEAIRLVLASPTFFSLLKVELELGKMYTREDEGRNDPALMLDPNVDFANELAPAPLIISHELWQRRYGGDPGVLGRSVDINGQRLYIQGVAPKGFRFFMPTDSPFPSEIDAWMPFVFPNEEVTRTAQMLVVFGRLKPGVSLADAQGQMDNIAAWQRENFEFHKQVGMEIRVIPMHQDVTGHVRAYLVWFMVAAGLLLLIVFANVTNLLLLRSWDRRREISIRAAMGGGPRRLAAGSLIESTVLAFLGGALGLLLAWLGIHLLLALQPEKLPRVEQAGISWEVLVATLGLVLLGALVCGLVPAFQSSRYDLAAALSERSSTGQRSHLWLRKSLGAVEIALSLFLLITTGLVLRSFTEITRIDPGFRPERVLTAQLNLPFVRFFSLDERADIYEKVVRQAAALPGVEAAGGIHPLPLSEEIHLWWGPWATEDMNPEDWTQNKADFRQVVPGYMESMGVQLLKGRFLTEADNQRDARYVAVVDNIFARRAWPDDDDPVGKRLLIWQFGGGESEDLKPTWVDVVGMIGHIRDTDLTKDGQGTVYAPHRFYGFPEMGLTLKSSTSNPMSLVDPLRKIIHQIDPALPLVKVRLMEDFVDEAEAPARFALNLIGIFAVIATILAAVGLYGVISVFVQQHRQEIGIRMAFGAVKSAILGRVLRESMVLTASGLALGLVAAFFLTKGLSSFIFGVTPTDPLTFTVITLVQVAIALVASLVPAWRATGVDPVTVLRAE